MLYHLADDTTEVVVAGTEEWPGAVSSTWSPDGEWIAFERLGMDQGDGSPHRLFRVRADGTSLQQVGNIPCAQNPAWSPDGQRIAFGDQYVSRGSEETGDSWTVHPDGTGRRAVLRWSGTDGSAPGRRTALGSP
jgi:Tol biopolymer transport system component